MDLQTTSLWRILHTKPWSTISLFVLFCKVWNIQQLLLHCFLCSLQFRLLFRWHSNLNLDNFFEKDRCQCLIVFPLSFNSHQVTIVCMYLFNQIHAFFLRHIQDMNLMNFFWMRSCWNLAMRPHCIFPIVLVKDVEISWHHTMFVLVGDMQGFHMLHLFYGLDVEISWHHEVFVLVGDLKGFHVCEG